MIFINTLMLHSTTKMNHTTLADYPNRVEGVEIPLILEATISSSVTPLLFVLLMLVPPLKY